MVWFRRRVIERMRIAIVFGGLSVNTTSN